jgi:predicted dithiol-disulfide oxidoreductase (DUF899 family)
MEVEREYCLEGWNGPASLFDMFDDRRQLVVYRFFFALYARLVRAGLWRLLLP